MDWISESWLWAAIATLLWLGGLIASFHAVMQVRSERAAIAWGIGLLAMPAIALPVYAIFGRRKFGGYREAIGRALEEHETLITKARANMAPHYLEGDQLPSPLCRSLEAINRYPFTSGNHLELLIDGQATFDAIAGAMAAAEEYILFQFFIIHDDELGRRMKDLLIERARAGVRVHFLYDEIGSIKLPQRYKRELREAGVEVDEFGTRRGRANRFQVNFRNHRKIVVVDGRVAFVGGHNVGDEYLGKSEKFGPWRDTHVQIDGPAVLQCQAVFLSDWYWATGKLPEVCIDPQVTDSASSPGGALIMPTGPALNLEVCQMALQAIINGATQRLWIASPYLVPDEATLTALKFAAKRGVDVRLMIPAIKDHLIVYLAGFSFFEEMEEAGIQLLRYDNGFMHQKVILVDDHLAGVGTVNLDNRSISLNFEITAFSLEDDFIGAVEQMLEEDFKFCTPATGADFHDRPLHFRIAVRIARLFSPIL